MLVILKKDTALYFEVGSQESKVRTKTTASNRISEMDDFSLPSVLCADLAIFPLPILRCSFMEENCFRIVYDTVRNYGIVKNLSGSYFIAQNVEIFGIFLIGNNVKESGLAVLKYYKAICVERLPLKVTLQIAGLITEIETERLETRKANMQITLS